MPGKAWFITGCSQGIGRSLARELLQRGERVAATARDPATLEDLKELAADRLWVGQLDVTRPEQRIKAVEGSIAAFGRIDVLVNNAAYGLRGAAEEVSDEEFRQILETDLVAPMAMVRAFLPHFRARGGGHIFQISSQGGQIAFAGSGAYNAAKWGLEGYSEALVQEVAPFNVGVTIVQPGGALTEWGGANLRYATPLPAYEDSEFGQMRRSGRRRPAAGDPDKMARAIADAMDRGNLPLRLHLGSDTIRNVKAALEERLATLLSQAEQAAETDADRE